MIQFYKNVILFILSQIAGGVILNVLISKGATNNYVITGSLTF